MIKFFTTGGTIDKVYFDKLSEFQVGKPQVEEILAQANAGPCEVSSLLRKDSLDMSDADRDRVREAVAGDSADRVVITHGTDTMVQTARALQGIAGKTIVLVGAMSPATLKDSDAPFNVGFALAAAQCLPPGVYIAMNGRVFHADEVRKNRAAHRFEEM
ncbi:MAG TPA: asparaginase domain-containing protein [Thermoflexales bacterium]|nr:asparaginase domain-containing protein [Thermoflexales bacterium]HQW34637.1 asparaginase domain-containing protein [Thermoflexales bacterium]HQZ23128.1 asparaginase domain-containing protein [Thermoflexales bacterium]